jgi:hypothetical protein
MANKSIQSFHCDVFQTVEKIPPDVDVASLCAEMLDVAGNLLGIIDGNIPADKTISYAAKFLVDAARAGCRSLEVQS